MVLERIRSPNRDLSQKNYFLCSDPKSITLLASRHACLLIHSAQLLPSTILPPSRNMCLPTPTQAFRNIVRSPKQFSDQTTAKRSKTEGSQQHYTFTDLSTNSEIRPAWRSDSVIILGTSTTAAPAHNAPTTSPAAAYVVVTDANFQTQGHGHGECLAHPWGCDCEKVQRPTMGQHAAWQVMATRYKAVHGPAVCASSSATGANAPLERRASEPLPHRANAPRVEDLRARPTCRDKLSVPLRTASGGRTPTRYI